MSSITIHNKLMPKLTSVPDIFIEKYMPQANGEFVKIYLYLLSTLQHGSDFSSSLCADHLACTEKDILRALRYWEKTGLIDLSFDNKQLSGIALLPLTADTQKAEASADAASVTVADATSISAKKSTPAEDSGDKPVKRQLSSSRVKELCKGQDPEIRQLIFITEQYLGRTLSATDLNRILYFYDELHFSVELLDYLIEYCANKGKTSSSYIQKVGLSWYEQNITTVEQARSQSNRRNRDYYTVLKAYGIRSRDPIDAEVEYIDRWQKEYGCTLALICEACERTIRAAGKQSLEYTDRILQSWRDAKISSLEEVKQLDERYRKEKARKSDSRKKTSASNNRFNDFQQREYDFSALEADLFRRQFPDLAEADQKE